MRCKRLVRKTIGILNSNWGRANSIKRPLAQLFQYLINCRSRTLQSASAQIIPETVAIETSTICNSRCIFCPHGIGNLTRKKEIMDNDFFFRIVDICKKENIRTIMFGGMGEFLCDRYFLTKTSYIVDEGLILGGLGTNAMLLNKDISNNLISLGLKHLTISIDSLEKSKYEEIRKGLIFEQVINNILYFLELNLKNYCRVFVTINVVLYKNNIEAKTEFINKFKNYFGRNFRLIFYPIHNWGGLFGQNFRQTSDCEFGQLKSYCPRIFGTHILVRIDGSVSLCCQDFNNRFSLGIIDDSVKELWNGPKIIEIRKKHLEGRWDDIAVCKDCTDIILGKRCIEEVKGGTRSNYI